MPHCLGEHLVTVIDIILEREDVRVHMHEDGRIAVLEVDAREVLVRGDRTDVPRKAGDRRQLCIETEASTKVFSEWCLCPKLINMSLRV